MNLQSLINSEPPNSVLQLPPGEFFGQATIDRPLTIVGTGKSTWIGSRQSPCIRITSAGVTLRDLMVEVAAGSEEVAIESTPGTNPILWGVHIIGHTTSIPPENIRQTKAQSHEQPISISFLPPPPISADIDSLSVAPSIPDSQLFQNARHTDVRMGSQAAQVVTSGSLAGSSRFTASQTPARFLARLGWGVLAITCIFVIGTVLARVWEESAQKQSTRLTKEIQQYQARMAELDQERDRALEKASYFQREQDQLLKKISELLTTISAKEQEIESLKARVRQLEPRKTLAAEGMERCPPALANLCDQAQRGYEWAQYDLGWRFQFGSGVQQDTSKAIVWYERAAKQGHAAAKEKLMELSQRRMGGAKNPLSPALNRIVALANQNYDWAQYELGWRYHFGSGVQKDIAEAIKWYRKAADQGHATAREKLIELTSGRTR